MIPFAELNSALVGLVGTILSGGMVYAWVQWRKVGPEMEAIGNKSLIEVNSELRTEIDRLSGIVNEQRTEIATQAVEISKQAKRIREQDAALTSAESRILALTQELDDLESRRDELGH